MWTVWPILIFLYHLLYSANYVSSCKNGTICNHGYICQDNVCKECIKCDLLFRKGSDCESDFNNCGPCLAGYKEISTTHFSNIVKPCRPKKLKTELCADDDDCPFGSYCYEEVCAICFDCSLLNKLPPINRCAKNFNQCGFCMEGFYELPVTTNLSIKPCEREAQALKNLPRLVLSLNNNVLPFCILLAFAAVVVKLFIRKNTARNDDTVATFGRSLSPSAPPLLVPDITESVMCEEKNENCSTVTLVTELKQQANMARVFKQPHAAYYFADEGTDDASDHSNDSNENGSSAPQRREPGEVCSLNIFIHRYAEIREPISPSEEMNESMRDRRQFNVSVDDVDSVTPEDASKNLPQSYDSNSSKS